VSITAHLCTRNKITKIEWKHLNSFIWQNVWGIVEQDRTKNRSFCALCDTSMKLSTQIVFLVTNLHLVTFAAICLWITYCFCLDILEALINKLEHGTKAKVLLTETIWFLFEVDKFFHSKVMIFYISWKFSLILSLKVTFVNFKEFCNKLK